MGETQKGHVCENSITLEGHLDACLSVCWLVYARANQEVIPESDVCRLSMLPTLIHQMPHVLFLNKINKVDNVKKIITIAEP